MMSSLMSPRNSTSLNLLFEAVKDFYYVNDMIFIYAFSIVFMLIYNSLTLSIILTKINSIELNTNEKLVSKENLRVCSLENGKGKTFYFSERGKKLHTNRDSRHLKDAQNINEVFFSDEQIEVLLQLQCISDGKVVSL